MAKSTSKIIVSNTEIAVTQVDNEDYISLTDMLKAKDGDFFISDWLRNRNTVEYLGIWESIYNPRFNYGEFAIIKSQAGLNSYKISVKEWAEKTNAVGLRATAGRYGGACAHKELYEGRLSRTDLGERKGEIPMRDSIVCKRASAAEQSRVN